MGKSSFINRLAGSKRAKVEDRPESQGDGNGLKSAMSWSCWICPACCGRGLKTLRSENGLLFTGAVKDDVIDTELLAMRLLEILNRDYPEILKERYKVETAADTEAYELLELVGRKREC